VSQFRFCFGGIPILFDSPEKGARKFSTTIGKAVVLVDEKDFEKKP
jgi:hypothetical protein